MITATRCPRGAVRRLGTLRFRHGGGPLQDLLLTPDGKTLVSNDYYGNRVRLCLGFGDGETLASPFREPIRNSGIALSPDGKLIAIGQTKAVVVWDWTSGRGNPPVASS